MVKKELIESQYSLNFLSDILNNHIQNKLHTDNQLNWVIGISGIIIGLIINVLNRSYSLGLMIILISSLLAFVTSLYAFEPLNFKRKKYTEDLMFYTSVKKMSLEEYTKRLKDVDTKDKIIEQYAIDIKNLVDNRLIIQNKYLKFSVRCLILGVSTGSILFLLGL